VEHWLKEQLNEAHKLLDGMGVLDRETRPDWKHPSGENVSRNGKAKLSPRDVLEIRTNPNREKMRQLASRFGVSPATVSLIRSGKRWADVGG